MLLAEITAQIERMMCASQTQMVAMTLVAAMFVYLCLHHRIAAYCSRCTLRYATKLQLNDFHSITLAKYSLNTDFRRAPFTRSTVHIFIHHACQILTSFLAHSQFFFNNGRNDELLAARTNLNVNIILKLNNKRKRFLEVSCYLVCT